MSKSKTVMYGKLQKVQIGLMEEEISSSEFHVLLPLIFKACLKEKLTFWFTFAEEYCLLNLRDTEHENYELNIKYAYESVPVDDNQMEFYKESLLINTFLITKAPIEIKVNIKGEINSEVNEAKIKMGNAVPPTAIRTVMDMLEKNGEPVTRKSIQKYLQMDKMSTDNRRKCIAYLKTMEE